MIHAVTSANRNLYANQLTAMHKMRYHFYVAQRGWSDGLTIDEDREYDEFDRADTVYLMNLTSDGQIKSTFRLMPTINDYLLDRLPQFVNGPIPRGNHIWDMTRWIIAPSFRKVNGERYSKAHSELACGLFEFAATRGITHYTTLMDTRFLPAVEQAGWKYELLGLPAEYGDRGETAIAVIIDAGPESLAHNRMIYDIDYSILFESPPPRLGERIEDVLARLNVIETIEKISDREARMATWGGLTTQFSAA
ncbi:4-coumaroyl-homoserine lactone synthase [Candidatus Phycosocius bacilliformis]|uniref:Acyl-homoserine-lactone synthase n=1 Tax=Candidatus Phycosocius bacilliformis TaxID=1445552 RepID=A0A2P2EDH5_9PROT|nr:acyl-homoserine-lactone synthase [Candidatus Phycosocius bacilliformis]GBF59106.1 4-coumaroyl-homoserine lactone synthase [Candidatus Phycosocius bacilliformis]